MQGTRSDVDVSGEGVVSGIFEAVFQAAFFISKKYYNRLKILI